MTHDGNMRWIHCGVGMRKVRIMKKIFEVAITTPSGQTFSHYFSSLRAAEKKVRRTRLDWYARIEEHKVYSENEIM